MKKIIFTIAIALTLLTPISSLTWQGTLDAAGTFAEQSGTLDFEQANRVTLSLNAPFGLDFPMEINAAAFYEFTYGDTLSDTNPGTTQHLFDIPLLSFAMQIPLEGTSFLALEAGRFAHSDITGLVAVLPTDGIRLVYFDDFITINTSLSFTGLLNAYNVSLNAAPNTHILSDAYSFAAPFVLANAAISFPYLFLDQSIFIEAFTALDVGNSTPNSRFYSTLALSGELINPVSYVLSSTLGLTQGIDGTWTPANLSTVELSTFLPFASSLLTWKTTFATGDANPFTLFTVETANLGDTLEYSGLVKTGLVATVRPVDSLLVFLSGDTFFNMSNPGVEKGYSGAQWLVATRWNLLSDINVIGSVGQFISAEANTSPYLEGEIKLLFYF